MDVITFAVNLLTTSGLSNLIRDVISLPDATSCDKFHYPSILICVLGALNETGVLEYPRETRKLIFN